MLPLPFLPLFVTPSVKTQTLDDRRAEVDRQAAASVAATPAFVSSLTLPAIPPSLPPLERKRLEGEREHKVNDLARAAGAGNESEFRRIMLELNPNASDLTIATSYTSTRSAYLQRREALLVDECANTIKNNPSALDYWMRQLVGNEQKRWETDRQPPIDDMMRDSLLSLERKTRAGLNPDVRTQEELLQGAIEAGFPPRAVFAAARSMGLDQARSQVYTEGTVLERLVDSAAAKAGSLFEECASHYRSDPDGVEFNIAFRRLTEFCLGFLPDGFDRDVFGQSQFRQEAARNSIDSAIRAAP